MVHHMDHIEGSLQLEISFDGPEGVFLSCVPLEHCLDPLQLCG